ncbi:MAG: cytochrome c [Aestuariivirga sp.]|uniref:c-type cytochrome n=1 Tax=Aestuariivirga sp. TaxID=2650926 RepID=UPI0025BE57BD|nr:cytochrome c [Aestuariivirga sp.]MCA3561096.1 cytochrome c [Aestuariivirga sp.]
MVSKISVGLFTAAALAIGLSSAAMADAKAAIEARQACMKANAGMMKVMVPIIKGQKAYDKAAIDAAIGESQKACGGWAGWWGEDTKPGTPAGKAAKTEAKAEIWTDKAGFEAAGAAYVKAEAAVQATTDEASFKAAFPALGKSCQSCHETFRQAD